MVAPPAPRKALIIALLILPVLFSVTSSVAAPAKQAAPVTIHIVQPGETLYGIALFYGVSIPDIARTNNIVNPDLIFPGQILIISYGVATQPTTVATTSATQVYTVRPGDTLSELALQFGTTVAALAMTNNITNPNLIIIGQRLVIPSGTIRTQNVIVQAVARARTKALKPAVCNPSVRITFPRQGEVLDGIGTFNITGTADIDDFQFYKLELGRGKRPIEFWSIDEIKEKRIINGILLRDWNTGALPEGTYTLRLTAVDNRGQFPRPCDVVVKIDHRPPEPFTTLTTVLSEPVITAQKAVAGPQQTTVLGPAVEPLRPARCNPSVRITFPRQGETLNGIGTYNISGTADIDDFQFYKLELGKGRSPIEFWSIDEIQEKKVVNGILIRDWNTGALPEGTYILRLTVVDKRGQFPAPCDVKIRIKH